MEINMVSRRSFMLHRSNFAEKHDLPKIFNAKIINNGLVAKLFFENYRSLIANCFTLTKEQKEELEMYTNILYIVTMTLSLMAGSALAGALDNPANMTPFFTDSGMKTMKSPAQFKAAWMAMSEEDRAGMSKECSDQAISAQHSDFCKTTKQLGGAN